jgi:hypothetical protein
MQAPAAARRAAREELSRRAREEIERRRETPEFRAYVKAAIIAKLHVHQRGVLAALMAGVRFVALCCGRRAGKTHLLASLIILRLLDANFGEDVVFAAPTLDRGKELIWDELTRMNDEYCLGWQTFSNTGKIRTPWGARFRIVGLEAHKSIGKQRGGNIIAFFCDESQEFVHRLQELLVAVGPGLTQRRGWFIASGTPGPARRGYWFRICHGEEGFKGFRWYMRENPHLGRDPEEIIAEEKARYGWADDNPTLLREYYGLWVDDAGMLVCDFLESRNALDQLPPDYDRNTWKHFIGVDYGFSPDPCAWVVAAAHPHENRVVILHVEKHLRFTSDQIAEKTNVIHVDFKAKRIVGDSASGGSTFIEDWNRRYGAKHKIKMRQADKADKAASIDMLNTELRTGRLQVVRSGAGELIEELLELQWKDPEHTAIQPGPDHAFDALRYVLRALNAYRANPKEEEPDADELERRRIEERMKAEAARQKAQKRLGRF